MTKIVLDRVKSIQKILVNSYHAGAGSSSSTKGNEREFFINSVLASFFPHSFRFGTGDVTDATSSRSGQLDVVMEYPLIPSIPVFGSESPRLYLAEGVAAIIEVKSDLSNQWQEVCATGDKIKELNRNIICAGYTVPMKSKIPYLAVGFKGWKSSDTLLEKVKGSNVDAAMVLNENLFANKKIDSCKPKAEESTLQSDEIALWSFVKFLYTVIGSGSMLAYNINDNY